MAQAVLVPLLVCKEKVGPSSLRAIRSMMVMQPPPSFTVCSLPLSLSTQPFTPGAGLTHFTSLPSSLTKRQAITHHASHAA